MIIPTKILIHGDQVWGSKYIGDGHRFMAILENLMAFQGLEQHSMHLVPAPGVLITCTKVFDMRTLEIFTRGAPPKAEPAQDVKCLCFPHFSFSIVMKVTPAEPVQGIDPVTGEAFQEDWASFDARQLAYVNLLYTTRIKYDLAVCTENKFTLMNDVLDANFGRYNIGQFVLATIGDEMLEWDNTMDCDRGCLMEQPRFVTLMIAPFHIMDKMKKWWIYKE